MSFRVLILRAIKLSHSERRGRAHLFGPPLGPRGHGVETGVPSVRRCCAHWGGEESLFDSRRCRLRRNPQIAAFRNRNAFEITDTELKLIAAAAIIGLNKSPKNG